MTLRIGYTSALESLTIANLLHQRMASQPTVVVRAGYADRRDLLKALARNEIDIAPEYAANLLDALHGQGQAATEAGEFVTLRESLATLGIVMTRPAPARAVPALVMLADRARTLGITSMADLATQAGGLAAGGPDGNKAKTSKSFGLSPGTPFRSYASIDQGGPLQVDALRRQVIDVALTYSSDPAYAASTFAIFEAPTAKVPADHLIALIRADKATAEVIADIDAVLSPVTTEALKVLNSQTVR